MRIRKIARFKPNGYMMSKNILHLTKKIFIDRRAWVSSEGIIDPKEEEITDNDICIIVNGTWNIIRTAREFKRNNAR